MLKLLLASVVFICLTESAGYETPGKLVFANVVRRAKSKIYRHGDRTPKGIYRLDPYKNKTIYWPEGLAKLMPEGEVCQKELGLWMRKRYGSLIRKKFNANDIEVHAGSNKRCIQSALFNLKGLYGKWSKKLPLPIHKHKNHDEGDDCPKYDYLLNMFITSNTWYLNTLEQNQELFDYLTEHTGDPVHNLTTLHYIYDTLMVEEQRGLTLPTWVHKYYPEPLATLNLMGFTVPCYTRQMARLKMGSMIRNLMNNLKMKAAGEIPQKLIIYSSHESVTVRLLQALYVFNDILPACCVALLMELRVIEEQYFVQLLYRNSTKHDPYVLTLPGCTDLCPLGKFEQILQPVIPRNLTEECRMSEEDNVIENGGQ